jgi:hypothetical protein
MKPPASSDLASTIPASAAPPTGEVKSIDIENRQQATSGHAGATQADDDASTIVASEIGFDLEDSSGGEESDVPEDADGGEPYDELAKARWCEVRVCCARG